MLSDINDEMRESSPRRTTIGVRWAPTLPFDVHPLRSAGRRSAGAMSAYDPNADL